MYVQLNKERFMDKRIFDTTRYACKVSKLKDFDHCPIKAFFLNINANFKQTFNKKENNQDKKKRIKNVALFKGTQNMI